MLAALWCIALGRPWRQDERLRSLQPIEGRLANRLSPHRHDATTARMLAVTLLRRRDRYDRPAYRSVARLRMRLLSEPLRLVSDYANFSKPWYLVSGLLALFRGSRVAMEPADQMSASVDGAAVDGAVERWGSLRRHWRRSVGDLTITSVLSADSHIPRDPSSGTCCIAFHCGALTARRFGRQTRNGTDPK